MAVACAGHTCINTPSFGLPNPPDITIAVAQRRRKDLVCVRNGRHCQNDWPVGGEIMNTLQASVCVCMGLFPHIIMFIIWVRNA